MLRTAMKYVSVLAALLCVMGVAMPQHTSAQSGSVNVAGGYSFLNDRDLSRSLPKGWFASVAGGVNSWLSIAGELAHNSKTLTDIEGGDVDVSVLFYGGGPRFVSHSGKAHPFGQVLFGAARRKVSVAGDSASDTNFAWQPGAGIDWDLNRDVALRFGANGRFIHGDGETSKQFQFIVGVVFRRNR